MKLPVIPLLFVLSISVPALAELPKAPVLSPSGLDADAGDGKVYLEWNPNTEPEVTGYNVYRWAGADGKKRTRLNARPIEATTFVDASAANDTPCSYAVSAVFKGGETPLSRTVAATPAKAAAAKVTFGAPPIPATATRPEVKFGNVITIEFANGHAIVFDVERMKWCDWRSPDGQHLLYPCPYGNPIDLCSYNNFGFSETQPATASSPAIPPRINLNYAPEFEGRVPARWLGQTVDGQRVMLSYRIPLWGPGEAPDAKGDTWIWATIRETWFPVSRKIGGTAYAGLARRIELDVPSFYNQDGFSMALNDAFGVDGSCDGCTTYRAHSWAGPRAEIVAWKAGESMSENGKVRDAGNFHPTEQCLQTHPFVFIDHPKATVIVAPRRQYYCTVYRCTNYAQHGHDGIWPNFLIDLAGSRGPLAVDTFEYLYSADRALQTPQRYLDARFYFFRRMAALYDLPPYLPSATCASTLYLSREDPLAEAKSMAEGCGAQGTDLFVFYHPLWLSASYAMDEDYLTNPKLPENKVISNITAAFAEKGAKVSYWVRPEFVKSPRANILSDRFFTPYYGYGNQAVPPLVPLLERRGLPMIRSHMEWLRKGRDGSYPAVANYHWTPMSMAGGWLDQLVWNTFRMSAQLGCRTVFFDGGFGGMNGVDYTPGHAVPMQPYWWRLFRLVKEAGLDLYGECGVSWGGGYDFGPIGKEFTEMPWWFANGTINPPDTPVAEGAIAPRHRLYQVYCAVDMGISPKAVEDHLATKFMVNFLRTNGHPDRVVLKNLRNEDGKWVYDGVDWEYADGRRVEYPNSYK